MEVCDAALVDRVIPERETNRVLNRINADQKQDGADQVEVEVYHRGTAGILGAAHRGQELSLIHISARICILRCRSMMKR